MKMCSVLPFLSSLCQAHRDVSCSLVYVRVDSCETDVKFRESSCGFVTIRVDLFSVTGRFRALLPAPLIFPP